MTEAEWLAAADPVPMLKSLRGKASERKFRLFAVGCCRRLWPLLDHARSREAVDVAERLADGDAGPTEARCAVAAAGAVIERTPRTPEELAAWMERLRNLDWRRGAAAEAALATLSAPGAFAAFQVAQCQAGGDEEWATRPHLVRCVFAYADPRPGLNPGWLRWDNGAVAKLARAVYADRAFDHLPVLADALEDAGCTDARILGHLRGPGPHCRGCWPVDLVLGKE